MGFTSVKAMVDALEAGQTWSVFIRKGTNPYTAELAANWYDMNMSQAVPIIFSYPGVPLQAVQLTDQTPGALWHGGNVSTATKHILQFSLYTGSVSVTPAHVILCDYLMYYPGIDTNSTAVQTLTSPVTLPRYATGAGVQMFIVYTGMPGNQVQKLMVGYTNSAGVQGRYLARKPNIVTTAPSNIGTVMTGAATSGLTNLPHNHGLFLPLAMGDIGVRSVQSVQFNLPGGGEQAAIVLCKPLCSLPMNNAYNYSERNYWLHLPSLPRVYDGAYLSFLRWGGASAANSVINGQLDLVWG